MLETFRNKKLDVTGALSDLTALAGNVGARSLSTRLDVDLVQKLEADRFHLVVVGEFNHGKTTFVNALLGAEILPVGVTPTTAVIHHLEYAETPRAEVVYASGDRATIPFEEVNRFAVAGSQASEASDVKFIEVGYPAALLQERIVLVDTPGVNDLSLQRADITYSYIPRSDAVLFLLDAGQPLKESERVFLQDKLLAQSRSKIIFVVTKRDIWNDEEQSEALIYIRTELGKLIKDPVVLPVSAHKALEGDVAGSGMPELMSHLTKFLSEERGRILLDNALGEGIEAGRVLRRGIDARRRAVLMTGEELTRRIEHLERDLAGQTRTIEERRAGIREEIAAIRAWARRDLDHFVDGVIKQIPAAVDAASPSEIKVYLGSFLEKTLTEWAQKETREIASALEALAEKTIALVREDAHDAAKRVGQHLGSDMKTPNVEVDTFGYDVGVFALFTVGLGVMFTNVLLGGLLFASAPVLAMYVKGKVESETRKKAKEMAPAALREAAAKVGPRLDEMIQEFAQRLDAWVVTAGEELHREVIEVLVAARNERASEQPGSEEALKVCDEQGAQLDRVQGRLEGLRSSLWTPSNGESVVMPAVATGAPNAPGGTA
jgi:GTP-binding protein EngB required for normal cell division